MGFINYLRGKEQATAKYYLTLSASQLAVGLLALSDGFIIGYFLDDWIGNKIVSATAFLASSVCFYSAGRYWEKYRAFQKHPELFPSEHNSNLEKRVDTTSAITH